MIEGYFPTDPKEYLRMELNHRKQRNSNYSIRAFARDLNLSPSHLSEFLSGKTSISVKKAKELSAKLKLPSSHCEHWADLVSQNSRDLGLKKAARIRVRKRIKDSKSSISLATFKVIADWYHFAILAFFGANSKFTVDELSQKLKLKNPEVREAIHRLIKLDLLTQDSNGFCPVSESSFSGDSAPSSAIRDSHRQVLKKATEAIDDFGIDQRESQSLFFSVRKDRIKAMRIELKEKVFETVVKYTEENLEKDQAEVFALTWHMFPLDQKGESK